MKGLPRSITQECLRAPRPNNYAGLVQRAQETVALYGDMNQLYGKWETGNQNQNWRSNQSSRIVAGKEGIRIIQEAVKDSSKPTLALSSITPRMPPANSITHQFLWICRPVLT